MAKKADLLEKAKELKLEVSEKNTIAEIEEAIAGAEKHEVREATVAKAGKRQKKHSKKLKKKPKKKLEKKQATRPPRPRSAEAARKKARAPKVRPRYRTPRQKLPQGS